MDQSKFTNITELNNGPRIKTFALIPGDPLTTADFIFKDISMPIRFDSEIEPLMVQLLLKNNNQCLM